MNDHPAWEVLAFVAFLAAVLLVGKLLERVLVGRPPAPEAPQAPRAPVADRGLELYVLGRWHQERTTTEPKELDALTLARRAKEDGR